MYLFFNLLQIKLYFFQQNIYQLIANKLNNFNTSIFLLLLISGLLTSINPCSISLIPISISSMINTKNKNIFLLGLISSMLSIIILGLIMNQYYQQLLIKIPILSSFLMIILGLHILDILKIHKIYLNSDNFQIFKHNYMLANYTTGFIIGLSSSSCSTPIIITILFWISYSNQLLLGTIYLVFYLIGYIAPLLLVIHMNINTMKLKSMNTLWKYVIPSSGAFILSLGIFSLLDTLFI